VGDRENSRPGGDAGALSEAYERLREAVLSGGAGGWRLGHGVLCARGTTAWMSAIGELAPHARATTGEVTGAQSPASGDCEPLAGRPAGLPAADQVVAVLTQMVLPLAA
jgi:hypothetical protein